MSPEKVGEREVQGVGTLKGQECPASGAASRETQGPKLPAPGPGTAHLAGAAVLRRMNGGEGRAQGALQGAGRSWCPITYQGGWRAASGGASLTGETGGPCKRAAVASGQRGCGAGPGPRGDEDQPELQRVWAELRAQASDGAGSRGRAGAVTRPTVDSPGMAHQVTRLPQRSSCAPPSPPRAEKLWWGQRPAASPGMGASLQTLGALASHPNTGSPGPMFGPPRGGAGSAVGHTVWVAPSFSGGCRLDFLRVRTPQVFFKKCFY